MGKEKKKHKKSSKHKKHTARYKSSSDESSSSEEEWVEQIAPGVASTSTVKDQLSQAKEQITLMPEQDDWVSNPALFPCISRKELRQSKENSKDKNEDYKYMLDKLGQTDRELNPYWKDGGSGLPSENPVSAESLRQATVTVGDQGSAWLRKALQRAKEQSVEQGRSLQAVVAERWGSLEKLENMIAEAEERDKKTKSFGRPYDNPRQEFNPSKEQSHNRKPRRGEKYDGVVKDSTRKPFAKPNEYSDHSSDNKQKKSKKYSYTSRKTTKKKKYTSSSVSSSDNEDKDSKKYQKSKHYRDRHFKHKDSSKRFANPSNTSSEDEDKDKTVHKRSNLSSDRKERYQKSYPMKSGKGFAKPRHDSESDSGTSEIDIHRQKNYQSFSGKGWRKKSESDSKEGISKLVHESETKNPDAVSVKEEENAPSIEGPVLTDKEMNDLAAKLVKAELLGNQEMAEELKAKLDRARGVKANRPIDAKITEKVIILTHTDSKGFTRPVSLGGLQEPTGGRRKSKKVETHSGGKRMRYFADDDKYTLQDMFQREKLSTVEDSNAVFAKLASKGVGRDDSARDMEDVFEETARIEESEGRKQARDRQQAIEQSKRTARSLDNCQWCLESKQMLKHLIIAIGNTCYLCVPPYQSLTENHCLIVPNRHSPCATQLDEDVWAEMKDFRKSVVQMFLSQDEDVVFFESAQYLNKFPHMVLNCVPMPKETGDLAPIYFKKAIQECEMEWSNNKKLVDLRGRNVRSAVPKGLPYFAVDFGLESGFAHVIEDEQLFPKNFAQEIIGGMLDLDHTIWRKHRKQTFEEQSKKVIELSKLYSPFDFTKK